MGYVVLDTGSKGAMVYFNRKEPVDALAFERMGKGINPFPIWQKFREWKADMITIESISARPQQGVKATATQFFIVGQCHTLAQLYFQTIEYISPQTWTSFTKRLSATPHATSKEIAQELAPKFYPEFSKEWIPKRGRKVHDGIADCLLMNLYIQRDIYVQYLP